MTDTQRRIKAYQAMLPGLKERVLAVALLLIVSLTMVTSTTFAWLTISRAPEVTGVSTTVAANGNLEIALVNPDGDVPEESKVGDSSAAQNVTLANITWGNLVNLSDESYGLENIILRPALLGNTNNLLNQPLKGVDYGQDGRVELYYNENFQFTNWVLPTDGLAGYFKYNDPAQYGVRAISTVAYTYKNNTYYQFTQMMKTVTDTWTIVGGEAGAGGYYGMISKDEYINALAGLIGDFMTDNLNDKGGTTNVAGYIPTLYELLVEFKGVADDFADVLVALVNAQVYNKYTTDYGLHVYTKDEIFYVDTDYKLKLVNGVKDRFKEDSVDLTCLTEYIRIVNELDNVLYGDHIEEPYEVTETDEETGEVKVLVSPESFQDYNARVEKEGVRNATVQFKEITKLINKLVYIDTCQIITPNYTYQVNQIGMSTAMKLLDELDSADARIQAGVLKDFEQLTGYKMCATDVEVSASYSVIPVSVVAKTITTTAKPDYLYDIDKEATEYTASLNKGEYTGEAKDTYGLAVDLWVRTNIANSYLVLEGNVLTKSEEVDATGKNADGETVYLYSLTRTASTTTWYNDEDDSIFALQTDEEPEAAATGTATDADGNSVQLFTLERDGQTYNLYQKTENVAMELTLYQGDVETVTWYTEDGAEFTLQAGDNPVATETEKTLTDGSKVYLHTLVRTDESGAMQTYTIYPVTTVSDGWYNAETYEVVTLESGEAPIQKKETITTVIGYEGENRVWDEDHEKNIWLSTDSTTQGSGSCYVFYAEDPGQQENCLRLLANLRVSFVDGDPNSETYGKLIAAGKLDIDNRFEESGKVTLPLVLYNDGSTYLTKTEDGMAIMPLEQNKATRLMVIVYLDGREISNADVLAANEIQGRLNIQFGTSEPLATVGDSTLELATRSVTAMSKAATDTGDYTGNRLIEFDYETASETNPMTVNVKVTVTGEQPSRLTGFFMRQVSSTQGSREPEFTFTKSETEEGVWIGSYTFDAPGTYIMRTVRLDGVDYDLPVGTEAEPGYPNVYVAGFAIKNVSMSFNGQDVKPVQTIMTSDRSITTQMSVELMDSQNKLPGSVRLQFVKEDGTQITATMTREGTSNKWSGDATFNSSGEYTLLYVIMDGEYFPVPSTNQREVTMYIGMTVRVQDNGDVDGRSFDYEYGKSTTKTMYVDVFDNTGKEITHMSGVKLIYMSGGVRALDADLKWNAGEGCYVGNLQIVNPGIYTFGAVTTGSSYLTNTTEEPPTFTCISPEPPVYMGISSSDDYVLETEPNDFHASVTAVIRNAEGASVTALLWNEEDGKTYRVTAAASGTEKQTFVFPIPVTDGADGYHIGEWSLVGLELLNVYDADKNFYGTINGKPVPMKWYFNEPDEWAESRVTWYNNDGDAVFALGSDDQPVATSEKRTLTDGTEVTLYTLTRDGQTYTIYPVTAELGEAEVKVVKLKVSVSGEDETIGEDGSVSFLTAKTTSDDKPITFTITDHNGDVLNDKYVTLGDVTLNYILQLNSWTSHGGYTAEHLNNQSDAGENDTYTFTEPSDGKTYTLKNVKLTYAGIYEPNSLTYTVNGVTYTIGREEMNKDGSQVKAPVYTLWTASPTVTITAISPIGKYSVDTITSGQMEDGDKYESTSVAAWKCVVDLRNSHTHYRHKWDTPPTHIFAANNTQYIPEFNDYSASVYFKCLHDDVDIYGGTDYYHYGTTAKAADGDTLDYHEYVQPTVTITLANKGKAETVVLSFGDGVHVYESEGGTTSAPYSWTENGGKTMYIGLYVDNNNDDDTKTVAGELTATELVISADANSDGTAETYKVSVSIKITNDY